MKTEIDVQERIAELKHKIETLSDRLDSKRAEMQRQCDTELNVDVELLQRKFSVAAVYLQAEIEDAQKELAKLDCGQIGDEVQFATADVLLFKRNGDIIKRNLFDVPYKTGEVLDAWRGLLSVEVNGIEHIVAAERARKV